MKKLYNFESILHSVGEKVTQARIDVLSTLVQERYPLSIKELALKVKAPNQSTLYRTLATLVQKRLVREIMLDKTTARYEIGFGREHHHHIVCTSCGFMEDIHACTKDENAHAQKNSKKFHEVTGHSLEFFGTCKSCVKR